MTLNTPYLPVLEGPQANRSAFLEAAAASFPRMANFSFDYGDSHWMVLDGNPYVDWSDRTLRDWIVRDLEAAKEAGWRFVAFHHPGFHSSKKHFEQQKTRLIAPLLEQGNVDVVFNGHVHNYQRSRPLRFEPELPIRTEPRPGDNIEEKKSKGEFVDGRFTLDERYDGHTNTQPSGILYVVTGGGGNHLYNPEQQDDLKSWQTFTTRYEAKVHSFTVADVHGKTLKVRQLTPEGQSVDEFTITKP